MHWTRTLLGAVSLGLVQGFAPPAQADERLWANCRTCHAVTAPDGRVLARGGRSGPNLFALDGRAAAGDSAFKLYSRDLVALRDRGLRWNERDFVAYLADPDAFLQAATQNPAASSDMHVQMRQEGAALWAWIAGLR